MRILGITSQRLCLAIVALGLFGGSEKPLIAQPKEEAKLRDSEAKGPQITIRAVKGDVPVVVVVNNFHAWGWPSLENVRQPGPVTDEAGRKCLEVVVVAPSGALGPPMLGTYRLEETALVFEPRFALRRGVRYRAILQGPLNAADSAIPPPQTFEFSLRAADPKAPAKVTALYPTGDVLPENQLKFYLHFSAPMRRGEVYQRVHLLNESGKEVERPFLQLSEELWDNSGTRLTLLFDPGRIKRGLTPREEDGPILEEGKKYTFVIDREWLDADGNELEAPYRREFTAAAPDATQPDVQNWKLKLPKAGTRDALVIHFPEPLDHAMLERVVNVADAAGTLLEGEVEVSANETQLAIRPNDAWKPGRYRLVVDTALEDRAGNSIAHPFEVDMLRPIERDPKKKLASRDFDIAPAAEARP